MNLNGQQVNADNLRLASLAGLFLLALLLRLSCYTGLIGSDDLGYSNYAQQIAAWRYVPDLHHYAIRYGVIVPVGFIYALAGVNEWSTVVIPLFASSLSVMLLAMIGATLFGRRAGLIAGLLYATFPVQLRYATVLLPEPVAACFVLLGILVYVRTERQGRGVLAGLCLGFAYLCKEPALFVALALFLDAAVRRQWQQAFGVAAGVATIIAVEHAYYLLAAGDPLFRSHAMVMHNMGMLTNPNEIINDLAYRLLKAYPHMMLVPNKHFGLHSLFALILSGFAFARFRRDRRIYFLLLWAAIPWLYLNFGSSSLTRYIALPSAPRYIEFAFPPLFLAAAWLLVELWSRIALARWILAPSIAIVLVIGIICGLATRASGYRTEEVAVLRVITSKLVYQGIQCAIFKNDRKENRPLHMPIVGILSAGLIRACADGAFGPSIELDPFGLPRIVSSVATTNP